MALLNWAGNVRYRARRVHQPSTLEEAQGIVASAPKIRVLGSRHTFTSIADSAELLSLDALPRQLEIDRDASTVRVNGSVRYGELAVALREHGLALANLASLPHISIAGAVATATHGSGDGNGNLATAVAALELITSSGEILSVSRADPEFAGMVVALGSLGGVVRVELDVVPDFEVRQRVYERLDWDALFEHFDEISGAGYSVSLFTLWGEQIEQLWTKRRGPADRSPESMFGALAAAADVHPIPGLDPANCTPQLDLPGAWSDRLPHFRMGFTPSSGAEIQSEFLVPREHAPRAIDAVRSLGEEIRPLLQISEIRTIAADQLWMSPQYGRDTVGIHFTWHRDQEAVERIVRRIEHALRPFEARPHWGKLFIAEAAELAPLYERLDDFRALAERLDPRGAFRNAWIERHVFGPG